MQTEFLVDRREIGHVLAAGLDDWDILTAKWSRMGYVYRAFNFKRRKYYTKPVHTRMFQK